MPNLPISVIVVAKNAELTVEESLVSIVRNNPAEIIFVDGDSTDRTLEIARRFTEKTYSDRGSGLSYARQLGAEKATQQYIAYVDSDVTLLTDDALGIMLTEFLNSNYVGISAREAADTKCSTYWEWAQYQQVRFHRQRERNAMLACLFRRDTILEYGFWLSPRGLDRYLDDMDLEIRLSRDGHVFGKSTAMYRHHYRGDFKTFAQYHFFLGRVIAYYIRRYGPWHAGFWPPLTRLYWLGFFLIRGQFKLIPYIMVDGVVQTAGLAKGLVELIGQLRVKSVWTRASHIDISKAARKYLFGLFRAISRPFCGKGIGRRMPILGKALSLSYRHLISSGTLSVEIQGLKIYADAYTHMARRLVLKGSYEEETTQLLTEVLREGMTVLDLGANIGYYSLVAARCVGRSGAVFAFEPFPASFSLLLKNVEANRLMNIIPVPRAVTSKCGRQRLFLASDPAGHSLVSDTSRESIGVDVTTVDEFVRGRNISVELVKMDVEGSEMAVLEGMAETIADNPKMAIITEFAPWNIEEAGFSSAAFLERLMGHGFRLHLIDDEQRTRYSIDSQNMNEVIGACRGRYPIPVNIYCHRSD